MRTSSRVSSPPLATSASGPAFPPPDSPCTPPLAKRRLSKGELEDGILKLARTEPSIPSAPPTAVGAVPAESTLLTAEQHREVIKNLYARSEDLLKQAMGDDFPADDVLPLEGQAAMKRMLEEKFKGVLEAELAEELKAIEDRIEKEEHEQENPGKLKVLAADRNALLEPFPNLEKFLDGVWYGELARVVSHPFTSSNLRSQKKTDEVLPTEAFEAIVAEMGLNAGAFFHFIHTRPRETLDDFLSAPKSPSTPRLSSSGDWA